MLRAVCVSTCLTFGRHRHSAVFLRGREEEAETRFQRKRKRGEEQGLALGPTSLTGTLHCLSAQDVVHNQCIFFF